MRRRLFGFCSAVSLLLFVAVCGLWVRSYRTTDLFSPPTYGDAYSAYSFRGETVWLWGWGMGLNPGQTRGEWLYSRPAEAVVRWEFPISETRWPGGLFVESHASILPSTVPAQPGSGPHCVSVVLPHWLLAVTFSLAPLRRTVRQVRRRRRRVAGLCMACGYDLRKSPERCPECGRAVA